MHNCGICSVLYIGTVVAMVMSAKGPERGYFEYAKNLYSDVMISTGYNQNIRPVGNKSDIISVTIGASLSQLIEVDERNQLMTVNIWLTQQWVDASLSWNPKDYDNVREIYVPSQSIWHPEIVLYNNADGQYTLTQETKAKLRWNGVVRWRSPGRLSSSCTMQVQYFPFDKQICELEFGSWTYNMYEVRIDELESNFTDPYGVVKKGLDMTSFYRSLEWDILAASARFSLRHYAGAKQPFTMWTFEIQMRRKYGFYVVNLIIPLVSHAVLTILVFYLPSGSKQKIPLSITIMLSLTVFFLLLTEMIPSTSIVLPLLGKYLLFTLILVTVSLVATVISLNVHFRSSATHVMPDCMRKVFLYFLPRMLCMRRPKHENSHDVNLKYIKLNLCNCACLNLWTNNDDGFYQYGSRRTRNQIELMKLTKSLMEETSSGSSNADTSPEVTTCIENAIYIANHLRLEDEFNRTKEDWKYVALVIDRIFLMTYITVCTLGTLVIICHSPTLYDNSPAISGLE